MGAEEHYQGNELELFRVATNWKQYIRSQTSDYLMGDVLEVGAGFGGTTSVLHDSQVESWTCLEPDAALASQLTTHVGELRDRHGRAPQAITGTLQSLAREPAFDCILYIDVLEHIEDDAAELIEAAARLRPSGWLLVLSPAHQRLYTPFDRAIGHFRRYDRRMITSCAPPECVLRRVRYLDSVGMLASAGNLLLLRRAMPTKGQIALWDGVMVPCSKLVDRVLGYLLGKSILAIWQKNP